MTYKEFYSRLNKRWWWILLSLVLINGVSYPWMSRETYLALYNVNLSLKPEYYSLKFQSDKLPNRVILDSNGLSEGYTDNTTLVSKYFTEFFSSAEAQKRIYEVNNFSSYDLPEKPPYKVTSVGNSSIEIRREFTEPVGANQFSTAVKKVLDDELIVWNSTHPDMLQLQATSTTNVVPVYKSIQMKLLPSLAALLLGFGLVLALPFKVKEKNKKLETSN
ncbi:MAG: hypothetical protein OHK0017_12960 [Patescibacteria group bacterium]